MHWLRQLSCMMNHTPDEPTCSALLSGHGSVTGSGRSVHSSLCADTRPPEPQLLHCPATPHAVAPWSGIACEKMGGVAYCLCCQQASGRCSESATTSAGYMLVWTCHVVPRSHHWSSGFVVLQCVKACHSFVCRRLKVYLRG